MCFICKENKKRTKKPVNLFWQDGAKAGIQTFTEIKLCQTPGNGLAMWARLWGKYAGQLAQQLTMRRKLTSRGRETPVKFSSNTLSEMENAILIAENANFIADNIFLLLICSLKRSTHW